MARKRNALIENIETGEQHKILVSERALERMALDDYLNGKIHNTAFGATFRQYEEKGFAKLDIENDEFIVYPEKKEEFLKDVAELESKLHFVGWADDWTEGKHRSYKRGA